MHTTPIVFSHYTPYLSTWACYRFLPIKLSHLPNNSVMKCTFAQHPIPARPAFDLLGDKAQGVLGRVLEENVDMVRVDRNVNYLDAHLRACAPDDRLSNKTNLSSQDIPAIFWGYHQMIGQQRHRMPVVTEFFHSSLPVHIHR